jgi:hypothetical protein
MEDPMSKKAKAAVPKKVGGVKVPAALRETGWLNDMLSSPIAREAIAAALVAGAAAAAAVFTKEASGSPSGRLAAGSTVSKGSRLLGEAKDVAGAAIGAFVGSVAEGISGAQAEKPAASERRRVKTPRQPAAAPKARPRRPRPSED